MNLTMETAILKKALDSIQRISTPKVGTYGYAGILFRAYKNTLEIETTDYKNSIRVTIPATIQEEGKVLAMLSYLPEMVKKMSGETIELKTIDQKNILHLTSGNSEMDVLTGDVDTYQDIDELQTPLHFVMASDQLKELFQQTQFAASNENVRPVFSGLLLEAENKVVRMVATDTYRLAYQQMNLEQEVNAPIRLLIPEKELAEVIRMLPNDDVIDIHIYWQNGEIAFQFNHIYFWANLIDGDYPDYRRVFPKTFNTTAIIDRRLLMAALERTDLIARNMTYRTVTMEWKDNQVVLSAISAEAGSTEDRVDCEMTGDDLEIRFNCQYLLDILKHSSGDTVKLNMIPNGPMLVEQENNPDYLYILTPMRAH